MFPSSTAYPLLAITGIVLSAGVWSYLLRNRPAGADRRIFLIYLSALIGAVVGAKLVFIAAEGWMALRDPALDWHETLEQWLVGKTILGALLGGYASVEIAKKLAGYPRATGNLFAVVVPMGLMLGRVGCMIHGCCLGSVCPEAWYTIRDASGTPRWPAVPLEFAFNAAFFVFALTAWRRNWLPGQVFHVYLMSYGIIRFAHEFMRDTPRLWGPLSGYHLAALAVLALGAVRFVQRATHPAPGLDGATAGAD